MNFFQGIQGQLTSLLDGLDPKDLSTISFGPSHSPGEHCDCASNRLLDDLNKEINTYAHSSDITKNIVDTIAYAKVIKHMEYLGNCMNDIGPNLTILIGELVGGLTHLPHRKCKGYNTLQGPLTEELHMPMGCIARERVKDTSSKVNVDDENKVQIPYTLPLEIGHREAISMKESNYNKILLLSCESSSSALPSTFGFEPEVMVIAIEALVDGEAVGAVDKLARGLLNDWVIEEMSAMRFEDRN
ncbi:uncharacterized protein EV420DRAFT_1487660 [Desarmillaria tabescens]|uniref:Uncharacterized protein n=1 Tax=Armillaria tabescens TaxID=1929756 RepID=A0AA39J5Z0_ARMTA|nr:uncharacterized protein EV420DRAFT_1487660 [Desarmillaria tabescens]KAK0436065.1 hypothetical protein EV420DRAFT_1487660 [Desarmillaria tabescens]